MITLTFNFKTSLIPVDHEQSFYSQYIMSVLPVGWNGREFDWKPVPVTFPNGSTEKQYDGQKLVHDIATTYEPQITEAEALSHSPSPSHYDLWDPFDPATIDGLFLRVFSHAIPPPPPWDRYVSSEYNSKNGGYPQYSADLNKYDLALHTWIFSDLLEAIIRHPVMSADLGYGESLTYGKVTASSPVFAGSLVKWNYIQSHPTIVYGSAFDDKINGGKFHDVLRGNGGNDDISGLGGNDTITGGPGIDTMTGGPGKDTFVFRQGFGNDVITDFASGSGPATPHDVMEFHSLAGLRNFHQVHAHAAVVGGNVVISDNSGDSITLNTVHSVGQLHAYDFNFLA